MDAKQVTDMFVEAGWITADQAHAFIQETTTTEKPIEQVMVEQGIVTEEQFFQLIADSLGTEVVDLSTFDGASHTLQLVPAGLARLHGALPIGFSENTIYIALIDPLNSQVAEDLRFALGREIHLVVAPPARVRAMILEYYGAEVSSMEEVLAQLGDNTEVTLAESGADEFNAQLATQEALSLIHI